MAKKSKRQKAIKRLNLSDHTLDINIRRCNYNKFSFSDIEDYVHELVGSRDYEYDAIKQIMIYLWGRSYKSITDLGKENYKQKLQIQQRFGTEDNFLRQLPLPDRLSGVVHMATGTGKSYVIFAIAYLSLVMGLAKRVLVLGPSSTIIEQGLREKFKELKNKIEFNSKLPQRCRGKAINLLTDNDPIEDDSIVIENINAVYTFGGITDTLFKNTDEVLVLGDEIHHAYSHLKYADNRLVLDKEEEDVPNAHIQQNYPVLTVTNHDKFADHIKELVDSVTESDMYLTSLPLTDREQGRGTHNFTLFNLNYIPNIRFEKADRVDQGPPGKLILTPFEEKLGVKVIRTKDEKRYGLARNFYTMDQIVYDIFNRFKYRTFEALHFDFGSVVVDDRYPEENEIMQVILDAMKQAGIKGDKLSEDNRKQIDNYFNQFLPRGKKKRIFENISGDLIPVDTSGMDRTGIRVSELERDRTAFLSEDYETEVGEANKFVLEYINELRGRPADKQQLSLFKPEDFVERKDEFIRTYVRGDTRPPYVVNT